MSPTAIEPAVENVEGTHMISHAQQEMPPVEQLAAGLCLVQVTVRSPDYRVAMKGGVVEARNDQGQSEQVAADRITPNKWIWCNHPIFAQIAGTRSKIGGILNLYSVPDRTSGDDESKTSKAAGGYRIMPIDKVPECWEKLKEAIQERAEIVQRLEGIWWSDVVPGLRDFFGNYFYQVRPSLPAGPGDLAHRYTVAHNFWPLTPIKPEELDLTRMSPQQRQEFILDQKARIQDMYADRFQTIFDEIVGGIAEKARDLVEGELDPATGLRGRHALSGGHRKQGCLRQIMDVLEKALMFKDVTNLSPEAIDLIQKARKLVSAADSSRINANKGDNRTTQAIRNAMGQVGQVIKQLQETRPRASRSIMV
jgi:hypothetical protein